MTPNPPPREVTVEHPDKVVWLVTAVAHKGERFTHGYAFFSEDSALHLGMAWASPSWESD